MFDASLRKGENKADMNVKRWPLWACLVLIFVSLGLLFHANQVKDTAQTNANEANEQVKQLQAQLDELKASSVVTLSLENARLRQDNQSLAQKLALANTNLLELSAAGQQTAQQLETARLALKLQQNHLQQLAVENQQIQSAAPVPTADTAADRDACLENLRQIDAAKQSWALDNSKDVTDVPTAQDLAPYLKGNVLPVCPSGGVYTIGAMNVSPTCSIAGHSLPVKTAKKLRWQSN